MDKEMAALLLVISVGLGLFCIGYFIGASK